jgi:nucleotide-binding universal stress UspA family protein
LLPSPDGRRLRRLFLPLDGSPLAEAVLPFVSRLAWPLGLEIALLRVVPTVTPEIVQAGTRQIIVDQGERLREEAEAYLREVAARLVADGFRVTTTVRAGEAAPEIVAGARECQADLIGMMTHGRTGLGRLFFGSVAEALLRHAAVPVFVVRATAAQLERSAA